MPKYMLLALAVLSLNGCAGAMWGYAPGTAGLQRSSGGYDPTTGTVLHESRKARDIELGMQIGARVGTSWSKLPAEKLAMGLAVDAHVDVTLALPKWGFGVATGYTSDRTSFGDHSWFYSGFPLVGYAQYSLIPRIFVHAGAGRILGGGVKRIEDDTAPEATGDASAWRGFAGASWVFSRSERNDFALRLEGRGTWSSDVRVADRDAAWTSYAVLAEILWVTF